MGKEKDILKEGVTYLIDKDGNIFEQIEYLKTFAVKGHPNAQLALGQLLVKVELERYKANETYQKDYTEAEKWIRKSAESGNQEAQQTMGWAYRYSKLTLEEDPEESYVWIKKAADQGYPSSIGNLGLLHEQGYGTKKDTSKAIHLYYEAGKAFLKEGINEGVKSAIELIRNISPNDDRADELEMCLKKSDA